MCLAQVGACGSATRTCGTSSFVGANPSTVGTGGPQEGAVRQMKGSCFRQGPCQVPREALLGEAYRSPISSSFGPLLSGIRRAE